MGTLKENMVVALLAIAPREGGKQPRGSFSYSASGLGGEEGETVRPSNRVDLLGGTRSGVRFAANLPRSRLDFLSMGLTNFACRRYPLGNEDCTLRRQASRGQRRHPRELKRSCLSVSHYCIPSSITLLRQSGRRRDREG